MEISDSRICKQLSSELWHFVGQYDVINSIRITPLTGVQYNTNHTSMYPKWMQDFVPVGCIAFDHQCCMNPFRKQNEAIWHTTGTMLNQTQTRSVGHLLWYTVGHKHISVLVGNSSVSVCLSLSEIKQIIDWQNYISVTMASFWHPSRKNGLCAGNFPNYCNWYVFELHHQSKLMTFIFFCYMSASVQLSFSSDFQIL